jgi:hypothetical protein
VRVVLRTGQPGQALEHSIILDYDINDFWCKTDLTTRKLFTTVIASLRGYHNLYEAQQRIGRADQRLQAAQAAFDAVRAGQPWSGEVQVGEPPATVRLQATPAADGGFTVTGRIVPQDTV